MRGGKVIVGVVEYALSVSENWHERGWVVQRVCPVISPCSVFRPQQKGVVWIIHKFPKRNARRRVLIIDVHKQQNVYKERLGAI